MNIYDILEGMIEVKKYCFLHTLFLDKKRDELDTGIDKEIFDILKNISSLSLKVSHEGAEFLPYLVFDGKRTFGVQDLTEDDYNSLSSIELPKLPLNLRARVADVLWLQKVNYKAAITAHESYYELFKLWFDEEHYLESIDMIKRAICIAKQLNDKEALNEYCQTIYNHIIRINGKDKNFCSISLIEIILDYSFGKIDEVIDVLNESIAESAGNPNKTERLYLLKAKCFNKKKNLEMATKTNIELAEYLLSFAEKTIEGNEKGVLRAEYFYQKAINTFRNNGEITKAEKTHKRLVEMQKKIPGLMTLHSFPFNGKKIMENINENMEGLNFEESIIRISQLVYFYKKDDFKKKVIDSRESFPLSNILPTSVINESGQTVFILPSLDLSNPESNEEIFDMHIHHTMLEYERINGTMFLPFAMHYIKEKFDVENESFDFLVNDSIVVPDERKNILCEALCLAFKGKYYESLHILAPQTENLFRHIAKEVGALTVTLEMDGTSKEKVLSSIFDLKELKECYDNDILFLFKGLLNEQAGANIRNNIAHGIMGQRQSHSGECLFFICAVIKLLVISSRYCMGILCSEKLKSYKSPSEDILSTVKENGSK